MVTISLEKQVVTGINTFTVAPENQQRALELLTEIAREITSPLPGFLSASFHKSQDGTRVVGYAQYTSLETLQAGSAQVLASRDNPLLVELRGIATPDSRVYEVSTIVLPTAADVTAEG